MVLVSFNVVIIITKVSLLLSPVSEEVAVPAGVSSKDGRNKTDDCYIISLLYQHTTHQSGEQPIQTSHHFNYLSDIERSEPTVSFR